MGQKITQGIAIVSTVMEQYALNVNTKTCKRCWKKAL